MKNSKIVLTVILSYLGISLITFVCGLLYLVSDSLVFAGLIFLIFVYSVIAALLAKKLPKEIAVAFCAVLIFLFILIPVVWLFISVIPISNVGNDIFNILSMVFAYPALQFMMLFCEGAPSYYEASMAVILLTPVVPCVISALIIRNRRKS